MTWYSKWFRVTCLLALALTFAGCLQRSAGAATPDVPVMSPVATASPDTDLSARLEGPRAVEDGTSVPVTFTLTNNTDHTLYVLTWFTPLEGIANEIFTVTHEGTRLPYNGILAMRGDPTPEAYVALAGGATTSATVDLATSYDFSQPGDYGITFLSPRISHVATSEAEIATTVDELGKVEIPCDPITVTVSSSEAGEVAAPPAAPAETAVSLTAIVGRASPSARIITLEAPVDGISTIALLETAEVRSVDGQKLTLSDLQPGMHFEALGEPGDADALLAIEVHVLDDITTPAAPDPEASDGMQTVVDKASGLALRVPTDWTVIPPGPTGRLTILQSFPKDTYVGSGGVSPPDTKCDFTVHPTGTRAADLIAHVRAEPQTTILSEEAVALRSGRKGVRMDLETMGPARMLIAEVETRAVSLICFGDLQPFDKIAATIGSAADAD